MGGHITALLIILTSSQMMPIVYGATCPAGWTPQDIRCFKFGAGTASWDQAQAACSSMYAEGHLATVDGPTIDNYIRQYASAQNYRGVWLGAALVNGRWVWTDSGVSLSLGYQNWAPGEPTGTNRITRAPENCMSAWKDSQYAWNDVSCATQLNYVCEATEPPPRFTGTFNSFSDIPKEDFYKEKILRHL